jgi:maltose O-acetyltransferase
MKHNFLLIYAWFVRTLFFFFPDVPLLMRIRGFFYGLGMKRCGSNFQITHNAIIRGLENMELGRNIYFANNVLILATELLLIEDEVMFGPNVVAVNGNHALYNSSYRFNSGQHAPIKIGFGSWIAANSVITTGAELPASSVLAANSVLNKAFFEKGTIIGGLPARKIGKSSNC